MRIHIFRKKILGPAIAFAFIAICFSSLELIGVKTGPLMGMTLFAIIPLAFAAVGECINQKAGLINVGLEGMLLFGAVFGAMMVHYLGHWVWGLLMGALAGVLIGCIFGFISAYAKANQIIAGLAINFFCMGLTSFFVIFWAGFIIREITIPIEMQAPRLLLPWVGIASPFVFAAIVIAIFAHYVLNRTILGIKIRAIGEKPESADVAGVNVNRIRMLTAILGGALAGFGGACLTVGWFGRVTAGITGGRGFIALAIVIFAGAKPLWALFGALLFGFIDAFSVWAVISPEVKMLLPPHAENFIKMIPFIIPLVVLAFRPAAKGPRAICKPYIRE